MGYVEIYPKADIGVKVWAKDEKSLIEESLKALLDLYGIDRSNLSDKDIHQAEIEGLDFEDLLISTLNYLIYLIDARKFIPLDFKIESLDLDNFKLRITFFGESWRPDKNYKIDREIKAATYHNIGIEKKNGFLETTIIFDV